METLIEILKDDPLEAKRDIELICAATLHPDEELRGLTIKALEKRYGGLLREVFAGDNQIMMNVSDGEDSNVCYVCDLPKEYLGERAIFYPFKIVGN
jgi:hypothetical protein